jgi:hypothetical protein
MNDEKSELENQVSEEDVISEIRDDLLWLAEEIDYASDDEKYDVAINVAERAYQTATKNGITFYYDDVDILSEEIAKKYFAIFEVELKIKVSKARRRELYNWIVIMKEALDEEFKKISDSELVKSEEDLEELFYDIVDRAVDKSI